MGINHLRKYINKYFEQRGQLNDINSDICYIDCTAKIYYSVEKLTNIWSKEKLIQDNKNISDQNLTVLNLINEITKKIVDSLLQQILTNKFYKKFILSFDYRYISYLSNKFILSDNVYNHIMQKITSDKKKSIESTPMIPITFLDSEHKHIKQNIDFEVLQESIRNMYEVRHNYWKPVKKILDYISLEYLKNINSQACQTSQNSQIELIDKLIRIGYVRYILIKEAKSTCRSNYKDSIIKSKDDISKQLYESDDNLFSDKFKEYFLKIPFSVVLSMIPNIIKQIKDSLPKEIDVEFIGCEDESDFAICRHIYKNYRGNCPTIYTKDTDFFLLLCKRNCVLKIPYEDYNVSIYTSDFWNWLLGTDDYTYLDIVALCCCFGTSYNRFRPKKLMFKDIEDIRKMKFGGKFYNYAYGLAKKISDPQIYDFLLALEIYKQSEHIENETRYIEPEEINLELINMKFSNIFSDLLLTEHDE